MLRKTFSIFTWISRIPLVGITSLCCLVSFFCSRAQESGRVVSNTNTALPASYNFQEYVFSEPEPTGSCDGSTNASATIEAVFMAQTHRLALDHPFFFVIGHRPALLQLGITGEGEAPDVQVEGFFQGNSLGTLCLDGPDILSETIDLSTADFEHYFSVTLPKSWVRNGLELHLDIGGAVRVITPEALKIGPYVEMNLVMVNMDVLDYNGEPHQWPIFERFLPELASSIPASVVRFGEFPVTLKYPQLVASDNTEQLVLFSNVDEIFERGTSEGNINSVAMNFLADLHRSTGDFLSTVYFGNTLNLAPGGWGGGGSFVSNDFTDIFIHELGHALSLPHWEETLDSGDNEDLYLYPYYGEDGFAGGRGEQWNFIQSTQQFESPKCTTDDDPRVMGLERSDAMQRELACLGHRTGTNAPWDGFGDFSALAMYRYLSGANALSGTVTYRNEAVNYRLAYQDGFPTVGMENGVRVYQRDSIQPNFLYNDQSAELPGQEQVDQNVYLIYGSAHLTQNQANIVYEPLRYRGNLPPQLDPTDETLLTELRMGGLHPESKLLEGPKDLTLRLTYADGTVRHVLVPYASPSRQFDGDTGIWRTDVSNFTAVVPADLELCGVQVLHRPFIIAGEGDAIAGNINDGAQAISGEGFLEIALPLSSWGSCANALPVDNEIEETFVYPNPFRTSLQIDGPFEEGDQFKLFDLSGRCIGAYPLSGTQNNMDVARLASGLYVGLVQDSNGSVRRRVKLIRQ